MEDPTYHQAARLFLADRYWFDKPALQFTFDGVRRPRTAGEWIRCVYNVDVFYGPVPFLKLVAVVSWLIAWSVR